MKSRFFATTLPIICGLFITINTGYACSPPGSAYAILTVSPNPVVVNNSVTLDGSDSYPSIVEYKWDFDEGAGWQGPDNSIATHTYTATGIYNAKLWVRSSNGGTDISDTYTVYVVNEGETVVPDVVATRQEYAESAIESTSLVYNPASTIYLNSVTLPAGFVISQNPTAGSIRDKGTEVVLTISKGPVGAKKWYVDSSVQASGTGGSWAAAFKTLQEALGNLDPEFGFGDEIWVTAGGYTPGVNPTDTFQLVSGVAVYGGFSGREVSRDERDWQANKTILSGNDNCDYVVTDSGRYGTVLDGFTITAADNAGVRYISNSSSPKIENCIVTDNGIGPEAGGIFCDGVETPVIKNCTITKNQGSWGGGIYLTNTSSPMIINTTISDNASIGSGGGIYCYDNVEDLKVEKCTISGNKAGSGSSGGGISCGGNNIQFPTITDCTFADNSGGVWGGAIRFNEAILPVVSNCIFTDNHADYGGAICDSKSNANVNSCVFIHNSADSGNGGGIYSYLSASKINNCIFSNNSASSSGGGIYMIVPSGYNLSDNIAIKNCVFVGNYGYFGGAIYGSITYEDWIVGLVIANCTFTENNSQKGGALYLNLGNEDIGDYTYVEVYNSILWGNNAADTVEEGREIYVYYSQSLPARQPKVIFSYCDIESTTAGYKYQYPPNDPPKIVEDADCINSEPKFVLADVPEGYDGIFKTSDDGLQVQTTSLCVDAGDDDGVGGNIPDVDILGLGRVDIPPTEGIGESYVDIGAYEVQAMVWYVDYDSTAQNPEGKSWTDAFSNLETALSNSDLAAGHEIWVAEGKYVHASLESFGLVNGVAIYGGFAGDETLRSQRNQIENETILSGDFLGNDGPNFTNYVENTYHVVDGSGTDATTVLDGFTITGGNALGTNESSYGGGIYNDGGSPTIANCKFIANRAKSGGGMANVNSSSPQLTNCTFIENEVTISGGYGGGGLYNDMSSPTLVDCEFIKNKCSYSMPGGAIVNKQSNPTLTGCIFSENHASGDGGAILNNDYSNANLTNCVFIKNTTIMCGGGICNHGNSDPVFKNCLFIENEALFDGGGFCNWDNCDPYLYNCTFYGNITGELGQGGGLFNSVGCNTTITNCIFRANTDYTGGSDQINNNSGNPTISYCNIEDSNGSGDNWDSSLGTDGGGNIDVNPYFVDPNDPAGPDGVFGTDDDGFKLAVFDPRGGDWQVAFGGSCLDSADNDVAPASDITGRSRIDVPYLPNNGKHTNGSTIFTDMGPYESGTVWYVSEIDNDSRGEGWSWDSALDELQDAVDRASPGDEIWVAAGLYKPGFNRIDSFCLNKAVSIYGGFAGTEYSRLDRDWIKNRTVLSGDVGDPDKQEDNCYHVVEIIEGDVVLDGFTITGGCAYANGTIPAMDECGGGIYISNASPKIANCIIRNNHAKTNGGGMYIEDGCAIVTDSLFLNNRELVLGSGTSKIKKGGGIYSEDSSLTLINCTLMGNTANNDNTYGIGGGIYSDDSDITALNCVFRQNEAYVTGGAVWTRGGTSEVSVEMTNCLFNANRSVNQTSGSAAAINSSASKTFILTNCTFTENVSRSSSTIIELVGPDSVSGENYFALITNSILWELDGLPIEISDGGPLGGYKPFIRYCDIEGGAGGINGTYENGGNIIGVDPTFVTEPEFYDKTVESGYAETIVVADVNKYKPGDIIEYAGDTVARVVTEIHTDSNSIVFDPPLGSNSTAGSQIKNWGRYAITEYDTTDSRYEIKGIARLQVDPSISPCVDAGLDSDLPLDMLDFDDDGLTVREGLPYDIMVVPRLQDISIAGSGNLVDMGAFESGGLTAADKPDIAVNEDTAKSIDLINDIGDLKGGSPTFVIITEPDHGTLTKQNDTIVIYTPDENYYGSGDEFYYKTYDGINYSEIAKVTISNITAVEDNPVAVDDEAWINEGAQSITIEVVTPDGPNDYDVDNDQESLTVVSNSNGTYGTTSININTNQIVYTVASGAEYDDSFTYYVKDTTNRTSVFPATVTVKVNHAPEPQNDSAEVKLGVIKVIDVLANDQDPEGHKLEITDVSIPSEGTAQKYEDKQQQYWYVVYKPDLLQSVGDTATLTYTVQDEFGLTNTATVTITIADEELKPSNLIMDEYGLASDSDGDGLSDEDEYNIFGTDPGNSDTDGDLKTDDYEIMNGSDPTNPYSSASYTDTLPYTTCFQVLQHYTPDESLDLQKGWKVENGTCDIEYRPIYSGSLTSYPFGCMVARLEGSETVTTTISKEFDDNGSGDDYSNIILIKLYPSTDAEVKIYGKKFGGVDPEEVIAAVKFNDSGTNKEIYYGNNDPPTVNSQVVWRTWGGRQYIEYREYEYGVPLKFVMNFDVSEPTCTIYWDADDSDGEIIWTSVGSFNIANINIDSITRVEFSSGSTNFDVRGLYINEYDYENTRCDITNPPNGDNVRQSRVPIKGWCCSPNMSGYKLVSLDIDYDVNEDYAYHAQHVFDVCDGIVNKVTGEDNVLGYWDTRVMPNGLFNLQLKVYSDLCYPWLSPRSRTEEFGPAGIFIGYRERYYNRDTTKHVATAGSVKNTTFRYAEEPRISVDWPGEFPFESRHIYDSSRSDDMYRFYPGWTNNNQIILTEYAEYYESSNETAKGTVAEDDGSGLAFGAIYVQYESGSMHLFRHKTGSISGNEAIYVPDPEDGSGAYIKRITTGKVAMLYVDYHPSVSPRIINSDPLRIDYELYRADGTKVVFHHVESEDPNNRPLAISLPIINPSTGECVYHTDKNDDGWIDAGFGSVDESPYYPTEGAVYDTFWYWVDEDYNWAWRLRPPKDSYKWRFVTAVKTKSDRFGNTLHYEWNEYPSLPMVFKVTYTPPEGGSEISIEMGWKYDSGWRALNYYYDDLKVDGEVERTIYYDYNQRLSYDTSISIYEKEGWQTRKNLRTYEYYGEYFWQNGFLKNIYNGDDLESNLVTAITYDKSNVDIRIDFVDETNRNARYYWLLFGESDEPDADGQCVFKGTSYMSITNNNPSEDHRYDLSIINENGQLRQYWKMPLDDSAAFPKATTYEYGDSTMPFKPTKIDEGWPDYERGAMDDMVMQKKTTTCKYTDARNLNSFGTNNPVVNFYELADVNVYDAGDDWAVTTDDTFLSRSEYDYHPYAGYSLNTLATAYQEIDQSEIQHTKPVETKHVYAERLSNGTYSLAGSEEDRVYLWKKKVRIAETGVENDDWAVTVYEYNHKTCDADTEHTPPHWNDAYALTKTTDPEGTVTLYQYDNNHHKEWVKVGLDTQEVTVERYSHDAIGRVLLKADTYGLVTLNDFNDFGQLIKVRSYYDHDALDGIATDNFTPAYYEPMTPRSTTIYTYNNLGQRTSERTFSAEQGDTVVTKKTEYTDGSGQPSKVTFDDPTTSDDSYIEYIYDGRGLKTEEKYYELASNPDQTWFVKYGYDPLNQLTLTKWYDYEGAGAQLLKSLDTFYHGSGQKAYEILGDLSSPQRRTDYKYDVLDRPTETIAATELDTAGIPVTGKTVTTSYGYDGVGNRTSVTDAIELVSNVIFYDYDNANRQIYEYFAEPFNFDLATTKTTAEVKKAISYYDDNQVKDAESYDYDGTPPQLGTVLARSEFQYDSRQRPTEVKKAIDTTESPYNWAVTVYDYKDAIDGYFDIFSVTENSTPKDYANMRITDAEGQKTYVAYTERGETAKVQYPSGQYQQSIYNGDGTLAKKNVFDSGNLEQWFEYSYDEIARLDTVTYPDDPVNGTVQYFYDGFGRMTQITDSRNDDDKVGGTPGNSAAIHYKYDSFGRLIELEDQNDYKIQYGYAADDQKASIIVKNPANSTIYDVQYDYDAAGRLTTVTEPPLAGTADYIAGFTYDENGNRDILTYYLAGTTGGSTVSMDYNYNPDNMLTGFTTSGGPTFKLENVTVDGLGRLTDADETLTKTDSTTVAHTLDFVYDMLSQLKSANITNIGGSTWTGTYTYKENGNMVSRNLDGTSNTFKYDIDDNGTDDCQIMTKIDTTALSTDKNGQLTAGPSSDTYIWNWDNKLRSATKSSTTIDMRYDPMGNRIFKQVGSTERKYIVDIVGGLPVVLMELNATNFNIEKTYIYANSQILAQHTGKYDQPIYFYLHDRLGSVRQIINTYGSVQNRYTHNPFGQMFTAEREINVSNPFEFTGQWFDSEIDQYYLRARMYDPHLGRFTGRDPIFGKFEEPLSLHKYLYCQNEPVSRIDPWGLLYTPYGRGYYNLEQTQDVIDHATKYIHNTPFYYGGFSAFGAWNFLDKEYPGRAHYDYKGLGFTFRTSSYGSGPLEGSEFGNYLAGYALYYNYGRDGEFAARGGGQLYGASEKEWHGVSRTGLGSDDWGSWFWITKGALDANLRAQQWYKDSRPVKERGTKPLKSLESVFGSFIERGYLKRDEARLRNWSYTFEALWIYDEFSQ